MTDTSEACAVFAGSEYLLKFKLFPWIEMSWRTEDQVLTGIDSILRDCDFVEVKLFEILTKIIHMVKYSANKMPLPWKMP